MTVKFIKMEDSFNILKSPKQILQSYPKLISRFGLQK